MSLKVHLNICLTANRKETGIAFPFHSRLEFIRCSLQVHTKFINSTGPRRRAKKRKEEEHIYFLVTTGAILTGHICSSTAWATKNIYFLLFTKKKLSFAGLTSPLSMDTEHLLSNPFNPLLICV